MNKLIKKIFPVLLLVIVLMFVACGKEGTLKPNEKPIISITSFEGVDSLNADIDTLLYSQEIFWSFSDPDGIVEGVSYRVRSLDQYQNNVDKGITTADNDVIDENGWIYHYQNGADESIPLNETTARTIWKDVTRATINFPAFVLEDDIQVPSNKISVFELRCKDDRGEISTVERKFFSVSPIDYGIRIASSQGALGGFDSNDNFERAKIGRGIVFKFDFAELEDVDYNFIDNTPHHFEYKLVKAGVDSVLTSVPQDWQSTEDNPEINLAPENILTNPDFFVGDFDLDPETGDDLDLKSLSGIIVRGFTKAGSVTSTDTLFFEISENLAPGGVIYPRKSLAIGDYHYSHSSFDNDGPTEVKPDGTHFGIPVFQHTEHTDSTDIEHQTMVYSPGLKIYMAWGYHGEYKGDNVAAKKDGLVLDEKSHLDYKSEILAYDIRFNGEPFNYPPLANSIVQDASGKQWLRVPKNSTIAQSCVLTNLSVGTHTFEMRPVDLSFVPDPTPAVFEFEVIDPNATEKRKLLIIDDTNQGLDKTMVDAFYSEVASDVVADFDPEIDIIDYSDIYNSGNHFAGFNSISLALLAKYENVIFHTDMIDKESGSIYYELSSLNLFNKLGGNLVYSTTSTLQLFKTQMRTNFLNRNFGISIGEEFNFVQKKEVPQPVLNKPYFIGANSAADGYGDLNLEIEESNSIFVSTFNMEGIGSVGYLDSGIAGNSYEEIYTFNCKPVGSTDFEPTEEEFNTFNGTTVGIKNTLSNGAVNHLFTFPISYMKKEQVKTLLQSIIQ